jgi:hypothetical protein
MFLNKLEPDHHKSIVSSDIHAGTMWILIYYLSTATPSLAMKKILPGILKGSAQILSLPMPLSRSFSFQWILPFALLIACPAFPETTTTRYRCSNGAQFSLRGDLTSAVRRNGIRVDLLLGGDSYVLISDNGASNARFVGVSGYQVVLWRENILMRYENLLGKNCEELQ